MKFFIAFSVALIASVHAGGVGYGVGPAVVAAGIANTGASAVSRSDDGLGNYAFGYNEDHASGGTFRKEKGGPGVQIGSYGLRDADGRVRTVNYIADALGFRASVSTNEPGVDPLQAPAATSVNGAVAAVAAAPVAYATKSYAAGPVALAAPVPVNVAAQVAYATKTYAAAPVAVAPIGSSYSVATQHVSAAPVALAAPAPAALVAPASIAVSAPIGSSYSVATQHVSAAPVAPAPLAIAGPVAYATKTYAAAPIGLAAPALGATLATRYGYGAAQFAASPLVAGGLKGYGAPLAGAQLVAGGIKGIY